MGKRFCITVALTVTMLAAVALAFQSGDVFQVQSITPMGGGRYDVKLMNERTHYVKSETVVKTEITFEVGDRILIAYEGGRKKFRKIDTPPKSETVPPGPKSPFELGTCGGGDASLNDWNKRFVARMNQEWQKSS